MSQVTAVSGFRRKMMELGSLQKCSKQWSCKCIYQTETRDKLASKLQPVLDVCSPFSHDVPIIAAPSFSPSLSFPSLLFSTESVENSIRSVGSAALSHSPHPPLLHPPVHYFHLQLSSYTPLRLSTSNRRILIIGWSYELMVRCQRKFLSYS